MRLTGLAPEAAEEAKLFAERYLEPKKRDEFLKHHQEGGSLWDWYIDSDDGWQDAIFVDNLCVPYGSHSLSYAERLDAIAKERDRFEAWREQQREVEPDHVC